MVLGKFLGGNEGVISRFLGGNENPIPCLSLPVRAVRSRVRGVRRGFGIVL